MSCEVIENLRYVIRTVDGDEYADDIARLHDLTGLPPCKYPDVHWWLTLFEDAPVGYLGLMQSILYPTKAYLVRVGVLTAHRGNRLQLRMMRVAEQFAKRHGYTEIISDTRNNPPSENNFIRAGYEIFRPSVLWAFADGIYWRKRLCPK
jgi:GNAT superfamily N-acetyltransferase